MEWLVGKETDGVKAVGEVKGGVSDGGETKSEV